MNKRFAAVVVPTVIPRQLVDDIVPVNPLVHPNMKLRNQGVGVVRGADKNLDQVATKLLDIALPRQWRSAFTAEAALDTWRRVIDLPLIARPLDLVFGITRQADRRSTGVGPAVPAMAIDDGMGWVPLTTWAAISPVYGSVSRMNSPIFLPSLSGTNAFEYFKVRYHEGREVSRG